MTTPTPVPAADLPQHPHSLGWLGTSALAMGGSNQSVFILGALLVGQGSISGQGTAAILLLMLGVVLGGRLGYVLFYKFADYIAHPLHILKVMPGEPFR